MINENWMSTHCRKLEVDPGVSRTLGRQLLRSGTSIGANVDEAQAAQSHADFINKMNIALKESRETQYWLRLLIESEVIQRELVDGLLAECSEVTKVLGAIVRNARNNAKLKMKNEK